MTERYGVRSPYQTGSGVNPAPKVNSVTSTAGNIVVTSDVSGNVVISQPNGVVRLVNTGSPLLNFSTSGLPDGNILETIYINNPWVSQVAANTPLSVTTSTFSDSSKGSALSLNYSSPLKVSGTNLTLGHNTDTLIHTGGNLTVNYGKGLVVDTAPSLNTKAGAGNALSSALSWSAISSGGMTNVSLNAISSTNINITPTQIRLNPGVYDISCNYCLHGGAGNWLSCGAMQTTSFTAPTFTNGSDVVGLRGSAYNTAPGGAVSVSCRTVLIVGGSVVQCVYLYVGTQSTLIASGAGPGFTGGPIFTSQCSVVQIS